MEFEEELEAGLPLDIPFRKILIEKASRHLHLIVTANLQMNLTRITNPREAAIKHVYDSVLPWQHFRHAKQILDAGTGAGFPGVPLSIVLPEVRFSLTESIQKKARFLDSTVESLELPNVHVYPERAETVALTQRPNIITARAVAPMARLLDLFAKAIENGAKLLLYKGPDVADELAEAGNYGVQAEIVCRYELPHMLGGRTLIQIQAKPRR